MFMPQMYPLSWIILFFVFSFIFFIYLSMMYFSFNLNPLIKQKKEKKMLKDMSWKKCW